MIISIVTNLQHELMIEVVWVTKQTSLHLYCCQNWHEIYTIKDQCYTRLTSSHVYNPNTERGFLNPHLSPITHCTYPQGEY